MAYRIPFPKKKKADKRGPFTFFTDGRTRSMNWKFILERRAALENEAEILRTSKMKGALHAATLVDAAVEVLFEELVTLSKSEEE
jgi:hypothetical protein